MTIEPNEAGWRALAETVGGDAEPSEFTDRRILKEAARIAAEQRAATLRAAGRRRWVPGALAASLALVMLGIGVVTLSGKFGAAGPDAGGDLMVPADAGHASTAPALPQIEVPLQFADRGAALLPTDEDQLAAALSQIDPCAAGVRLRLDVPAGDTRAAPRAEAVAASLRAAAGGRCAVRVEPAVTARALAGAAAVLVITQGPRR